jgi:hypothetical protein
MERNSKQNSGADGAPTWEDSPYYETAFGIAKSARYHAKMRAFFQMLSDAVLVGNSILATSAFVLLFKSTAPVLATWLTAIIAVISSISTALGFSKRADLHSTLARRFLELSAEISEWDANESELRKARAARLKIEMDEPPPKRLIEIQSRNEEARARGVLESDIVPLSAAQRTLGYFLTFGMIRLERWKSQHQD